MVEMKVVIDLHQVANKNIIFLNFVMFVVALLHL
jgi:hypothetical protein